MVLSSVVDATDSEIIQRGISSSLPRHPRILLEIWTKRQPLSGPKRFTGRSIHRVIGVFRCEKRRGKQTRSLIENYLAVEVQVIPPTPATGRIYGIAGVAPCLLTSKHINTKAQGR